MSTFGLDDDPTTDYLLFEHICESDATDDVTTDDPSPTTGRRSSHRRRSSRVHNNILQKGGKGISCQMGCLILLLIAIVVLSLLCLYEHYYWDIRLWLENTF